MPQKFLSIKNFDRYQHFKKASPPWIKLYRSTLDDREFINLPTTSKYVYLGLLILASEGCNKVFNDPSWISHRLAIKVSELDLKPLYKAGFLIASESTVYRETVSQRRDREETEREGEREEIPTHVGIRQVRGKRSITEEDKLSEKNIAYGQRLGVDAGPEWGKFVSYCKAHDKRYADFEAAFRNWLANAHTFKGGKNHAMR